MRTLLTTMLLLVAGLATAQIGAPVAELDPALLGDDSFPVTTLSHGGLLFELAGTAPATDDNLVRLGDAVGAATGMGDAIAGPVREFLEGNLEELKEQGHADIQVEGAFLLSLDVMDEEGVTQIGWRVHLPEIPAELFPAARHALGADAAAARVVIREFADLQCPHCGTFALEVMQQLEELLQEDPGLRFEFHHLPLVTIHANAVPAAEAAECVAELNGSGSFFGFSRLVFERMQAWQVLPETGPYFVGLAQEAGLETGEMTECLSERRHLVHIMEAADTAIRDLGLNGTPAVFVDGFRVQAWNRADSYRQLIEMVDARSASP